MQAFSKVYYQSYYKKPITTKWYNTYLAYYHHIEEDPDLTVDNSRTMEQQVNDSIRLDVTVTNYVHHYHVIVGYLT